MRCWSELIIDSCTTLIRVDQNSELISKTRNRPRIRIRFVCFWSPHLWFTIDQGNMNGWFWVPACIPVRRAGAKCKSSNISHQSRREKNQSKPMNGFCYTNLTFRKKSESQSTSVRDVVVGLEQQSLPAVVAGGLIILLCSWSYYWGAPAGNHE